MAGTATDTSYAGKVVGSIKMKLNIFFQRAVEEGSESDLRSKQNSKVFAGIVAMELGNVVLEPAPSNEIFPNPADKLGPSHTMQHCTESAEFYAKI